jgi:hypothetical protein
MAIWNIYWTFGNLVVVWYNCPRVGTFCNKKNLAILPITRKVQSSATQKSSHFPDEERVQTVFELHQ